MKNNPTNTFVKLMIMLVVTVATAGLCIAQSGKGGGGRMEGTWNVRVTIRDCQTGAEIRSFDSLGIFMQGGTALDSTSGIPQALKTPGQGIWAHVDCQNYRFKFRTFNFDAAGIYTTYSIIEHTAEMNAAADAYESAGTAKVFTPNGIQIATGCSSTTATRFSF